MEWIHVRTDETSSMQSPAWEIGCSGYRRSYNPCTHTSLGHTGLKELFEYNGLMLIDIYSYETSCRVPRLYLYTLTGQEVHKNRFMHAFLTGLSPSKHGQKKAGKEASIWACLVHAPEYIYMFQVILPHTFNTLLLASEKSSLANPAWLRTVSLDWMRGLAGSGVHIRHSLHIRLHGLLCFREVCKLATAFLYASRFQCFIVYMIYPCFPRLLCRGFRRKIWFEAVNEKAWERGSAYIWLLTMGAWLL